MPDFTLTRRWWIKTLAINGIIALIVLGAIQFIPVNRNTPPIVREPVWDSPQTRDLAVSACFDCHSNETQWPWYAKIAPVSWLTWYDVTEGREDLNFSDWDQHENSEYVDPDDAFPPKTLSERIEQEIRNGTMPPGTYQLMHKNARLSDEEKDALIDGLIRTVQANQAGE